MNQQHHTMISNSKVVFLKMKYLTNFSLFQLLANCFKKRILDVGKYSF